MLTSVPQPWRSFLEDIDASIEQELGIEAFIDLHCVGGFVIAMCYNLQRLTRDLDVFEVVPAQALRPLLKMAGSGSASLIISIHSASVPSFLISGPLMNGRTSTS